MSLDLATDDGLRAACAAIGDGSAEWNQRLGRVLEWWAGLSAVERATEASQQRLWEDNHVAAVGQGRIPVDRALADAAFRTWLTERSFQTLPESWDARAIFIAELYRDIRERLKPLLDTTSSPHLKIYRVIAVMFPVAMTTVASSGALHKLGRAMGEPPKLETAARHVWVRKRIDSVLGPTAEGWSAQAGRMALGWLLYERVAGEGEKTEVVVDHGKATKLQPLPAARRRRGLTATRGLYPAMLSTLEFVKDGVSREELLDFLKSNAPELKTTSLGVTINSYQGEFNVIESEKGEYRLTPRGENLLESLDPGHLADWILTRVLGADRVITELRDRGRVPRASLLAALKEMNPGWSTDFTPQAMLSWLLSMKVVDFDAKTGFGLTDEGRRWAALVHWKPEPLDADVVTATPPAARVEDDTPSVAVTLPSIAALIAEVQRAGHFPSGLIANLHSGLWSHPRRHFAVLAGLSGSGKTLLAKTYGAAVSRVEGADPSCLVLPVQPGWYDPGALLGYINPLRSDSFVRTAFLEFLQRASARPAQPHVVVLDEMNLSHPEQYMAPLLSAMETGDAIQLHAEDDVFDGVPSSLPYPANLAIIGTLNMDETTHGLSDKVLDRAFVLEHWDIDLAEYPRWNSRVLGEAQERDVRAVLEELMKVLAPARLHFGYRVVDAVLDYVAHVTAEGSDVPFDDAIDFSIYAKVLPKLRGEDSTRLRSALENCEKVLKDRGLKKCCAKVAELRFDLQATGSARFWR